MTPTSAARAVRSGHGPGPYAAAAGLLLVAGGCSRSVEVALPAQAGSTACAAVARAWPGDVSGLTPVSTSPSSPAVRAWGDPAVVARCGVASPGPSTDCLTVDDVDWVVTVLTDGAKFVTFGRSPALEVLVPSVRAAPGNEGSLLPVFSGAARALPTTGSVCSG